MKTIIIRAAALPLVLSLSFAQLDGGWLWNSASADGASSASQPGVHILDSDATGITLELYTPDFQVEPLVTKDITCDQLGVTDYATNDQAGWPALPVRGAMLGIPPDADVTLTVLSTDTEILPGRYELCPVSTPIVETGLTGEISFAGYQSIRNAQTYATNVFTPTTPAELVETGFIRSQRVAQIRFHPFQYNPTSGALRHLEHIQVRLHFNRIFSYPLDASAIGVIDEGVFEETLSNTLLNYAAARQWRTRPAPLDQIDWPLPAQTEPSYKIMVDEDGIYEVTYADLQAAGIATATLDSLDPRTFHLHNQGQETAIYVTGEEDYSFDPEDVIVFYGQKVNTKYTDTNVYWLTWGVWGDNGLRMPEINGSPSGTMPIPQHFFATRRLEKDLVYQSDRPGGFDNDHWYWEGVIAGFGNPASFGYTFTVQNIATSPLSATVRGILRGVSASPHHHTLVYLNGHLVDDAIWAAEQEYVFEASIPHSYLIEGTNAISISLPLDSGSILWEFSWLNWLEVEYYDTYVAEDNVLFFREDTAGSWEYQVAGFYTNTIQAFDITTPTSPTRIINAVVQQGSSAYTLTFQHTISEPHQYIALTPAQRLAPLNIQKDTPALLRSTANSANYIIITHASFYTDVLPLATYHISHGRQTVIVDIQDVYDEFSYGIFDPQAIQDFLAYTYANWAPPAPVYVLLVGDGHFDFKDNMGYGEPNYIPPYLADIDPWMGETAADNRYVCVSGEDILPDMHLGRLPVKTSAEADAMVAKILDYAQNPPSGDWNQKGLFIADNPDTAGNFYALSDNIIDNYFPAPYTAQKVYYGDTHTTEAETRAAIIDAIDEGQLIVNYVGHASIQFWSDIDIFSINDIAALTNSERLPFMVPMACLEGYYVRPSSPTEDNSAFGESIVRAAGKGAIASWSPAGYGVAVGHDYLNEGLYEALFFDGVAQLGPATTQGKLYLYSNSGGFHHDLIDTYLLFGDPALALDGIKAPHTCYLPIINKND